MPPFLYPPLGTSLLSFSDLCLDPTSSFTVTLSDATEARARLREALKMSSGKGQGGGGPEGADWMAVVDAAQDYLPHLFGLQDLLDADKLLQKNELSFSWHSALTHEPFGSTSSLRVLPTLSSEVVFALYAYAFALSNQAYALMRSVSLSSTSRSDAQRRGSSNPLLLTNDEEKRRVDKLSLAADYLSRASGVYSYISEKVLPIWELMVKASPTATASRFLKGKGLSGMGAGIGISIGGNGNGKGKMPVECSRDAANALAVLALADAHAIAIQKLLSAFPITATTSLLPLPKGHPPPSLLAKLFIHLYTLYNSSRSLLKTVGSGAGGKPAKKSSSSYSSSQDVITQVQIDDEVIPELLEYTKKEANLAQIRARKWLGVEEAEKGQVGVGIAWLQDALEKTKTGATTTNKMKIKGLKIGGMGNNNEKEQTNKERASRTAEERNHILAFLDVYTQLNNTVSFQPIPSITGLAGQMPSGRPILMAKPFVKPEGRGGGATAGSGSMPVPVRNEQYF